MFMKPELKPRFKERMLSLLSNPEDFAKFESIIHKHPRNFIRCNTLKISPRELISKLSKKWNVSQPFEKHEEIILVDSQLLPGELGNSVEHVLGYYYIQEIVSMLPPIALNPLPGELVLDLCASPGSKTTQIAAAMQNQGTLIANDFKIDKILLDAPCSGEGTLRSSKKTFLMWNEKIIKKFSRQQKKMLAFALKCLKAGGTLVYSTCTHAPEENESVIDFALKNFPVKVESLSLPLKCRHGISSWEEESFSPEVEKACRIYPQDNDSEGFFLCKLTLLEEVK